MNAAQLGLVLTTVASVAAAEPPPTANDYVARGMDLFRQNQIAEALRDFDQAATIDPQIEPHLWQRGICYYYLGDYEKGRDQFVTHRAVNPHDVENATWHFCCVARVENAKAARKHLIPIDPTRDRRVPMEEIYQLYAGEGGEQAVFAAADQSDDPRAEMYAHLYVGLLKEVEGDAKSARRHLQQAAAVELENHYMQEVAKVHLLQRGWDEGP